MDIATVAAAAGSGVFHVDRLSLASLSQPITIATSADLDDAIMESMETELFEGDGAVPSAASGFNPSSKFRSASSAMMACLAQGFSRLPDRDGSSGSASVSAAPRCNNGGGGGGGAASASAVTGGGNGTASATLTEALRCGVAAASATASAGGAAAGDGYSTTAVRSSGVAVEGLVLKPAGVSHDGVISRAYGGSAAAVRGRANGPEAYQAAALGSDFGPTHIARQRTLQPPPQALLFEGFDGSGASGTTLGMAAVAPAVRQALLDGTAGPDPRATASSAASSSVRVSGWASGSGTLPLASATAAGSCSSSASTVHPALAQVLAGTASTAAAATGRGDGGAAAAVPHSKLDLPFTVSEGAVPGSIVRGLTGGADGGGGGCRIGAEALGPLRQSLSWDIGPLSPIPVTAAPQSQGPCLSGSIAAAAFRSVSSVTGHPSLAAPYGGGGIAAAAASTSLTTAAAARDGGGLAAAAAMVDRHRPTFHSQCVPMSCSDPWAVAGKAGDPRFRGVADVAFPPPQLYDVLPDINMSLADQDGGERVAAAAVEAAASAAGGGSGDGANADVVSAAVRALLRLDQPFDLPYTQKLPPPDYDEALHAPSASGADLRDVADGGAYAPVLPPAAPLPPLPLPASVVDSLEPSGVPAVDRYLHQLLHDPSADRHVFLCKRPLGPVACRAIASCLRVCPGIKSITLSYCGITCEGVAALCEGLRTCRDLLVLDLSYNNIGDGGAAALAACLADMPLLATLTLAGNLDLTDAGAAALAAAVRGGGGGGALRRIGLRSTAASHLGLRELSSVLASNNKRSARRDSGVAVGGGSGSPVAPPPPPGGGGGGDTPVLWDGTLGSAAAATGTSDAKVIAQLCALLRSLVQPALAAEQAVAAAVAELMVAAPGTLAANSAAAPPGGAAGEARGGASAGESDLLSYLADGLRARGYDVAVTHALGGGSGGECLRNLRHTFLSVSCPPAPGVVASGPPSPAAAAVAAASLAQSAGSAGGRRLASGGPTAVPPPYHNGVIVVDPELREQFEVAMPTARYEALVSALPRVYVGAEERLPMVVEVMCDEMALALRSKGMVIPPWRESSAMISKWQPKQSKLLMPGVAAAADRGGGVGSGSASARSSATVTPRVSLAGGMAAAAARGGGTAPVPMLHRWLGDAGGAAAAGGAASRAAAAAAADRDGEPSLGPAPSLGSASDADSCRPDGSPLVQSFGFRRCTSTNSLSISVGLVAPIGAAAAAAAATCARAGGGGGAAGLSSAFAGAAIALRAELVPAAGMTFPAAATAASAAAAATATSSGCCISLSKGLGLPPVPFSPPSLPGPRVDSAAAAAVAAAADAAAVAVGSTTHCG